MPTYLHERLLVRPGTIENLNVQGQSSASHGAGREHCGHREELVSLPLPAHQPLADRLTYTGVVFFSFFRYLASCTIEFLFPSGGGSTFLQEHTQIRIQSRHTSCQAEREFVK